MIDLSYVREMVALVKAADCAVRTVELKQQIANLELCLEAVNAHEGQPSVEA